MNQIREEIMQQQVEHAILIALREAMLEARIHQVLTVPTVEEKL